MTTGPTDIWGAYAPSTGCFYPLGIAYGLIPADAIAVTQACHDAAIARGPQDSLAVVNGVVTVVPYVGPSLADAKAAQIARLNAAFAAGATAPVSFTTAAGTTASFAQDATAKANLAQALAGAAASKSWAPNLWFDATSKLVSPFTYADLTGLSAAIAAFKAPDIGSLMAKIAAVQAATTVAAVQGITL